MSHPSYAVRHLAALDGIRALAVVAVMLAHGSYGYMPGGIFGVDLFFVLSGYLITRILIREFEATGRVYFRLFYLRRAYRLLPALIAALLLARLLWQNPMQVTDLYSWGECCVAVFFYYANFVRQHLGILDHTWSLSMEEQFYLIWPVALFYLLKKGSRFSLVFWPVVIICGATVLRFVLFASGSSIDLYAFGPARIDSIMIGALAGLYVENPASQAVIRRWAAWRFPEVILVAFLPALFLVGSDTSWLYFGGFTLIALLGAVFLLGIAHDDRPTMLRQVLSSRGFRWIGKRSYGIYLYHVPIFWALESFRVPHSNVNFLSVSLARFAVVFAVAGVSYQFLEMPFLRRKEHLRPSA